jgi:hypothetical protein
MALPRDPVSNIIDLILHVNGFLYSMIFWLPAQLGLPIPPPIFAESVEAAKAPGGG